jgi:hypothetical protein
MFNFSQLRSIHLEITNNCQAACPMCSRNIHGGLENPLLKINNWSLEHFKQVMTVEVLEQIDSYYFCGNFGDPLLNNELIDMIEYSVATNSTTSIRIHTNGSLRSTSWWRHLARALPQDHLVTFAIDGLEDTNHLYRIGTDYNKIVENAKAFISEGGRAEWAYIRFKHNQHQVDLAKEIAKDVGFLSFSVKDSSRFLLDLKFPVYNKEGNTTYHLEPSEYSEIKFIDRNAINNYRSIVATSDINCQAILQKEIYIDAFGRLFPCCYIAMIPYIPLDTDPVITNIRVEILNEYRALLKDLGQIDTNVASIKSIINSNEYQTVWKQYWDEKKLITCTRTCGVNPQFSTPAEQFVVTKQLK